MNAKSYDTAMTGRMSRREWLKWSALVGAGLLASACGPLSGDNAAPAPGVTPDTSGGQPNEVGGDQPKDIGLGDQVKYTANNAFYTVDIGAGHPSVDAASYRFTLDGLVNTPLSLTLDQIKALPAITQSRTFECISNPVGGPLIGNAVWLGVQMKKLLDMAGVKPGAKEIMVRGADGFFTSIPIALAQDDNALIVHTMNGQPLPRDHGFPLRSVWPGRYGMKQPRWITRIEVIGSNETGYWEKQGWSNDAFIKVNSQILAPDSRESISTATYTIRGLAHAGLAGVKMVEVSTDNGATWNQATLVRGPEPTKLVWTEWRYEWKVPPDGRYVVVSRATTNDGVTQEGIGDTLLGGTYPDGTSRMHAVTAIVKRA